MSETSSYFLPNGSHLRHYTILEVLGYGGFGITYKVHNDNLDSIAVLKENMPRLYCERNSISKWVSSLAGQEAENGYRWSLERFKDEARTLDKLNHPNIISVKDAFEELGTAYYVMDYIEGQELHHATEGQRDEATLQHLLRRLLNALQYLHGKGILHRDIKPSNILVTQQGEPILIDFGTARSLISDHTHTGLASKGYTPFEQTHNKGKVGPWTDLYALGATFCHVLTGQHPPDSAARQAEDDFVPLASRAELKSIYSEGFLSSIDKALQQKTQDRWQTATEWLEALKSGDTPLHKACLEGNSTNAKMLLDAEADPNEKNSWGDTPLHNACRCGHTETVKLLLKYKAEINVKNNNLVTPLHNAGYKGESETVVLLLKYGADIHAKESNGDTPLHKACLQGNTETAKMLLEAKADPNEKNNWGDTPLHNACRCGHLETVKLLLKNGADFYLANNAGHTPMQHARERGFEAAFTAMLQAEGAAPLLQE